MGRGGILWLLVVLLAGSGLFALKDRVQTLETELTGLRRDLADNKKALHVLAAEWAYLNRPARLARLNRRYLKLEPVAAAQIVDIAAIPRRTPPPASHWRAK